MIKDVIQSEQLSWLDIVEPKVVDEDDLSYKDEDFIPSTGCPHMPEYIVKNERWANGDTSPEALEHMAEVMLGEVEVFKDTNMDIYKYHGVTTAIIGNKVWVAYQFGKKLVRYIPHPADTDDGE
jgi:hypothetical protein